MTDNMTETIDTDCRKCGKPMNPVPKRPDGQQFICTAYRCSCGHINDLKRRKANAAKRQTHNQP